MAINAIGRKALLTDGKHGVQRKIARQLEVDEARVSAVVNGDDIPKTEKGWKSYNRIQRAIAKAINLPVEQAFSEYERGVAQPASSAA